MSFSTIEQPRAKVRYLRKLTRRESEQHGSIAPPLILFMGGTIGTEVGRET